MLKVARRLSIKTAAQEEIVQCSLELKLGTHTDRVAGRMCSYVKDSPNNTIERIFNFHLQWQFSSEIFTLVKFLLHLLDDFRP
jgi:hypothetical protein